MILKAEFEKKKNLNKFNEEKNMKKDDLEQIKEKQDNYCKNFNMLLNTMGVGKKKKINSN